MSAVEERKTKRLFLGTFISADDQTKLSRLAGDQRLEELVKCRLRWVSPEKLHLTWVFFGEIAQAQETEIIQRLEKICDAAKSFSIIYRQAVLFPSERKPRMIVLTTQDTDDQAQRLATLLRNQVGVFCEKPEEKPFRPHITLMRFPGDLRGRVHLPEGWPLPGTLPIEHNIDSIALIESDLGAKDQYRIIREFRLLP